MIRKGRLGSMIDVRGARNVNAAQKIAVEESPSKIPLPLGYDVIHGYGTIFPVPLGESSRWDPPSAERSARVAAVEASSCGVRWTFAPMLDIARDPRWGRIVEGSGEGPFLGAAMGRARVRGFQGTTLPTRADWRMALRPGERKTVRFTLGPERLGLHDREMRFIVEPGRFKVMVGTSSVGGLEADLEVAGPR